MKETIGAIASHDRGAHLGVGGRLKHYRLIRRIGEGGFGAVYVACHEEIESLLFAIKVLHPRTTDGETLARFRREANLLARLKGRYTIDIVDYGTAPDGSPFLVMPFIENVPLDRLLVREGRLGLHDATRFTLDTLRALELAHRNGVVHRDLKPANLLVVHETGERHPHVKVIDFGIAKVIDDGGPEGPAATITAGEMTLCTPAYAAPELLAAQPSPRSDLYALGMTLLEMLTGGLPYGGTVPQIVAAQLSSEPVPIAGSALNTPVGIVIERALAKDERDRYANATAMREHLERIAQAFALEASQPIAIGASIRVRRAELAELAVRPASGWADAPTTPRSVKHAPQHEPGDTPTNPMEPATLRERSLTPPDAMAGETIGRLISPDEPAPTSQKPWTAAIGVGAVLVLGIGIGVGARSCNDVGGEEEVPTIAAPTAEGTAEPARTGVGPTEDVRDAAAYVGDAADPLVLVVDVDAATVDDVPSSGDDAAELVALPQNPIGSPEPPGDDGSDDDSTARERSEPGGASPDSPRSDGNRAERGETGATSRSTQEMPTQRSTTQPPTREDAARTTSTARGVEVEQDVQSVDTVPPNEADGGTSGAVIRTPTGIR